MAKKGTDEKIVVPEGSVQSKGDISYFQGVDPVSDKREKLIRPAQVINATNHPMELSYNGEALMLAPHARKRIADWQKVGAIPKGVTVVPERK